jgi:PAS domain S-box-containing protein
MPTRKVRQSWRELFEGPPYERAVRTEFARSVIGWMLVPLWILAGVATFAAAMAIGRTEPVRLMPAYLLFPGLLYVMYLRRQQRWLRAAAALSVVVLASISSAALVNTVHAPAFQGGFVVLALVISLFGTRWALVVAATLMGVGIVAFCFEHAGIIALPAHPPSMTRMVLFATNLLMSLLILGGMQRLLTDARLEATRKHREVEAARAAEAASESAFHAVFDQASVGLVLLTPEGEIAQLNQHSAELLGAEADSLIGKTLNEAPVWNEEQRALLAAATHAAADGQACDRELTVAGARGEERVFQMHVSPFHAADGGKVRVIVEIVEVSDLVRTRTLLAQAQRLEALGKLSGGVAHDINNMLAAIQGACELLSIQDDRDPLRIESREIIRAAVTRASSLTKQLLAFGRRDRFESVQVDVNRLVSEMGQLFERTLPKNLSFQIIPCSETALVHGDLAALENAVLNLALNARDAMPEGGTLTIRVLTDDLDAPAAAEFKSELEAGPVVSIRVSDTGSGMSEAVRERMFEPFFTTKPPGHGTGLGLPAVHGTVRNHRGGIAVHSHEGAGTIVELVFPRTATSRADEPILDDHPSVDSMRAHVLLADDEPLVREALAALLNDAGCTVQTVASGDALIETLLGGATVDVIMTDLMMPGLSGTSLVRTLEATRPGCPLLIVTGFTGDDVSAALTGISSHRLLRKPFSRRELIGALYELLPATGAMRPRHAHSA